MFGAATKIECSECDSPAYQLGLESYAECRVCGHGISRSDIDLDEGESLVWTPDGTLAYVNIDEFN